MASEVKLEYYAPGKTYPEKKYKELKNTIIAVIKKLATELNRKFDMNKIVNHSGSRGLLRDKLGRSKFNDSDLCAYENIIQELVRKDKILIHLRGRWYTRIK